MMKSFQLEFCKSLLFDRRRSLYMLLLRCCDDDNGDDDDSDDVDDGNDGNDGDDGRTVVSNHCQHHHLHILADWSNLLSLLSSQKTLERRPWCTVVVVS